MYIDRIHYHLRRHDWVGSGLADGRRRTMVYLSDAVMTNATFKHAPPSAHTRIREGVREVCMWVRGTVATGAPLHQSAKGASDAGTYPVEHCRRRDASTVLMYAPLPQVSGVRIYPQPDWVRVYCNPKERSRFFTYTNASGVECIAFTARRVYFTDSGRCYAYKVNGSPLLQWLQPERLSGAPGERLDQGGR